MKKLFVVCLILLATTQISAQKLSFEETVTYIEKNVNAEGQKSKVTYWPNEDNGWPVGSIVLTKKGDVTIKKKEGSFEWNFNVFNILKIVAEDDMVCFYKSASAKVCLRKDTAIEAERLAKAFQHLKTLCVKEKDPFDN